MSRRTFSEQDYLEHMLDAARQIQIYAGGKSLEVFLRDRLIQDGVVRNLEILGEAAKNLLRISPDVIQRYPRIPFTAIYATRNQIAHEYFAIDFVVVWRILENDLPELVTAITHAIALASGSGLTEAL